MAALKFVCVLVVCILVTAPVTHAITCGQVTKSLASCINYINSGGTPPVPCCNGIRGLNAAAKTTADRQAACKCLKNAASQMPGLNPSRAAALPGACGVNIPYKLSNSADCSKVR